MNNKFSTLISAKRAASQNSATLEAYNKHVKTYIKHTPQAYLPHQKPMLNWIDYSLSLLEHTQANILEIGSATIRDAAYIRSKGHTVQCSDGATGFVQHLQDQGENAIQLNVLYDTIQPGYDMIFANGVIQHFSKQEFEFVLRKVYNALHAGALFVFSVKEGFGEEWVYEKFIYQRYIYYWQPAKLASLICAHGFKLKFLEANAPGDLPNHRWIRVTAQK